MTRSQFLQSLILAPIAAVVGKKLPVKRLVTYRWMDVQAKIKRYHGPFGFIDYVEPGKWMKA
jgi:hypothetical protein